MPTRTTVVDSRSISSLLMLAALTLAPALSAHGQAQVQIRDAWSRATPPTARVGAAYFEVSVTTDNGGDRLIGASSPVAERATLHTTIMDGDVMKMRPLEAIEVTPAKPVSFKPGGHHVMLMGLSAPLTEGQRYPLTLTFEKAGNITIDITVRGP